MQKLYPAEVQSLNSCVISGGGRTLSQGGGRRPRVSWLRHWGLELPVTKRKCRTEMFTTP